MDEERINLRLLKVDVVIAVGVATVVVAAAVVAYVAVVIAVAVAAVVPTENLIRCDYLWLVLRGN